METDEGFDRRSGSSTTVMVVVCGWKHLERDLQLGSSLGVPRGLVGRSLDLHGHGEDGCVHGAGLGQQAILEPGLDLVQTHQSVHGVVGIRHPPVQH